MSLGTIKTAYKYWGFGLHIISDIQIPELLPADFDHEHIVITRGGVKSDIEGEKSEYPDHVSIINETAYYLDIKGVCRYYTDSTMIHFDPYEGADERSVRAYLLGSVMAFVLYRKGIIPLHASGIINNEKLVLFTGRSGAGKSTTAALMKELGYALFTDDICVIDKSGCGTASYPMLKLWDTSIALLDKTDYAHKDIRTRVEADKHGYFFHEKAFTGAMPVEAIFIITPDEHATSIEWEELKNVAAFDALAAQAYRSYLLTEETLKVLHFQVIAKLANSSRVIAISRPGKSDAAAFAKTIESIFNKQPQQI